jgi:hypothetical protein
MLNFVRGALTAISNFPRGLESMKRQAEDMIARMDDVQRALSETETDILFASVGKALSAWATMEEGLVLMVACLLRVRPKKAGIVMYSIHNFGTWLSVIHDLFDADDTLNRFQKRFGKITERIKRIKDTRDRLAHHSVSHPTAEIGPSLLDARSKSKKQSPLSGREVIEFMTTTFAIAKDVNALVWAMNDALPDPLPEISVESATDPSSQSGSPPHPPHTASEGQPPPSQELP